MTNYLAAMVAAAALFAGASQAATPAAGNPAAGNNGPRWVQAPAGGSLDFVFDQAGAASKGSFKQFTTELGYDEKSPATGSLSVKVQIGTVDTQDQERNEMLLGADLFDAQKFPTAQYSASSFSRSASGGLEAVGKLTLRGVTRDLRLPLKITRTAAGLELSGEAAIKRLDYGVGQGDWKTTEGVGDEVKIQYKVALVKAK
ncbi:MAG TPA: YceI family protein [Steroidobacteraceae bacterium]|nr:YceI family protein [Steroidobacteraceae bacterium]